MFSKIPISALSYYVDYSIVGIFLLLLFNSGEFKHVRLEYCSMSSNFSFILATSSKFCNFWICFRRWSFFYWFILESYVYSFFYFIFISAVLNGNWSWSCLYFWIVPEYKDVFFPLLPRRQKEGGLGIFGSILRLWDID